MDSRWHHSRSRVVNKRVKFLAFALVVFAGALAYQQWNKPHRDYAGESASAQTDPATLLSAFAENDTEAMARFGNQVVEVRGVVVEVNSEFVLFEPGVLCRWESPAKGLNWQPGETHCAKVRILSYDDLLGEVSGDFATPIN